MARITQDMKDIAAKAAVVVKVEEVYYVSGGKDTGKNLVK